MLSDTMITRSPTARALFRCASGAEQFVPPLGSEASFRALDMTLSRALSGHGTTWSLKASTSAAGLRRTTLAATRAATSMQRVVVVDPARWPVTGDCMDPDTSGQTNTCPSTAGTFSVAISIASWSASRTVAGTALVGGVERGQELIGKATGAANLVRGRASGRRCGA